MSTRVYIWLVFATSILMHGGCQTRQPWESLTVTQLEDGRSQRTMQAQGNWSSIEAAVEVGAGQCQCVVVRIDKLPQGVDGPSTDSRRFMLKHVSGQLGELVISQDNQVPQSARSLDAVCHMSPLGSPKLEGRIIRRVELRLRELEKQGFAPIAEESEESVN